MKTDDGGLRDKDWLYTWYDGVTGDTGDTVRCDNTLGGQNCNTLNYINAVNAAGLCGYTTGWRLPTRRELLSIVNNGSAVPSIDTDYFPNTPFWDWSADSFATVSANAWTVYFTEGSTVSHVKTEFAPVRLVRSGQ